MTGCKPTYKNTNQYPYDFFLQHFNWNVLMRTYFSNKKIHWCKGFQHKLVRPLQIESRGTFHSTNTVLIPHQDSLCRELQKIRSTMVPQHSTGTKSYRLRKHMSHREDRTRCIVTRHLPTTPPETIGIFSKCLYLYFSNQGQPMTHNQRAGVIAGSAHLALQGVSRDQAGVYTCTASNVEGDGISTPVHLQVVCK